MKKFVVFISLMFVCKMYGATALTNSNNDSKFKEKNTIAFKSIEIEEKNMKIYGGAC